MGSDKVSLPRESSSSYPGVNFPSHLLLLLLDIASLPPGNSERKELSHAWMEENGKLRILYCWAQNFLNVAVVEFCNQAAANFRNFVRKEIG